jgi:cupin fold WbuC family metalloprotein
MKKNNSAILWEEHLSYFTPTTFKRLFHEFKLPLIHFENIPYVLENSLIGIGRNMKEKAIPPLKNEIAEEKKRVNDFTSNFEITKNSLQKCLSDYQNKKKKIALLGAGHLSCGFINFLDIASSIECLIDDHPNKKGLWMPGSKLPIFNSKSLKEKNINLCLLSINPRNENKTLEKYKDIIGNHCECFSIFPESKNSLPALKTGVDLEKVSQEVFIAKGQVIKISKNEINFIKRQALRSERKRARICMHQDANNPIHEMIIAASREGYIRPHRHIGKSESFHMIDGEMNVLIFDENGMLKEIIEMGDSLSNKKFYYRLSMDAYHTVVIKSECAIFHETTDGPFDKEKTFFAPWSPKESNKRGVKKFMNDYHPLKGKMEK